MKPLIGVTPAHDQGPRFLTVVEDNYRALEKAGAIPVMLPMVTDPAAAAEVLARVDGLYLPGGCDVDPKYFGEAPHPNLGEVDPARDTAELLYLRRAYELDLPVLGVCRGVQVMAVAAGGALVQDLPAQGPGPGAAAARAAALGPAAREPAPELLRHAQNVNLHPHRAHWVELVPGTKLAELLGAGALAVNSRHHQAVKLPLPEGWVVSAFAPDGVIEAIEATGLKFAVGTQWHPENFAPHEATFDALFEAFVKAALDA